MFTRGDATFQTYISEVSWNFSVFRKHLFWSKAVPVLSAAGVPLGNQFFNSHLNKQGYRDDACLTA